MLVVAGLLVLLQLPILLTGARSLHDAEMRAAGDGASQTLARLVTVAGEDKASPPGVTVLATGSPLRAVAGPIRLDGPADLEVIGRALAAAVEAEVSATIIDAPSGRLAVQRLSGDQWAILPVPTVQLPAGEFWRLIRPILLAELVTLAILAVAGLLVHRRLLRPLLELRRLLFDRAGAAEIRTRFSGDGEVAVLARQLADVFSDLEERRARFERLAIVASSTANGLALTDSEGRLEWANATFLGWFGADAVDGDRRILDMIGDASHECGGERTTDFATAMAAGEGTRGELRLSAPDDTHIIVNADLRPVITDGLLQSFVIVLADMTGERELHRRVEAGREQLQAILDAVPSLVMYRDARGRIIRCNAAAAAFFGVDDPRAVEGLHYADLASDDASNTIMADRQVINTGLPTYGSMELTETPDGRQRSLRVDRVALEDSDPGHDGVLAIATDVTDQRSLESRLDFAMQTASLGIWEWEPRCGVLSLSPRLLELLGHQASAIEATIDGFLALVHEDDREAALETIDTGVRGDDDRFRRELRVRRGDGTWQWMLLAGRVRSRTTAGRAEQVLGVLIDIDQQKQDQATLASTLELAEAAGRARSAFLASMSHELRTPLTAILGYAELLQDPLGGEDDRRHNAGTILRNGRHLVSIIDDILDLSRIEAGRLDAAIEPTNLGAIVRDTLDMLQLRAEAKGLEVQVRLDGPVPTMIQTDPVRLRQILLNLVGNAVKFTEVGHVRLTLAAPADETGRRRLRVAVQDTGPGISDAMQGRIFKPFERADDAMNRQHGGTGLGLAISRRLAGILEGDISVASTVGEGSTFTLEVAAQAQTERQGVEAPGTDDPAAMVTSIDELLRLQPHLDEAAAATDAAAPAKPKTEHPLDGRRILLVEDGPDNQRLISHHLRRAGAIVDVAENGAVALECLRASRDEADAAFDLVVMDMQMPVMDGYAATRELRADGFDLPVIALTAHAMTGDRERCLEAGCTDYATKPIDRVMLIARCAELTAEARRARREQRRRAA